jgi:hypothetical protein
MNAKDGDFELLKDWQLLLEMNELSMNDCEGNLPESLQVMELIQKAKDAAVKHVVEMDLPFAIPDIRELMLIWPHGKD